MQRTCECLVVGTQVVAPVLKNDSIPFDVLLEASYNITLHWPRILGCEQCCANEHTPATLTQIAVRLLNFYEAALCSYHPDPYDEMQRGTHSPRPSSTRLSSPVSQRNKSLEITTPSSITSCSFSSLRAQMTLGQLTLDGEEALMLAQQLLGDYLLCLHELLEHLRALIEELMHRNTNHRLIMCESLVCQTMDRLAKLTGQLRFNSRKRKRNFSPTA